MCRQLNLSRHLSDNEALKVYCQARAGSWSTAEVNYFTLDTLGAFTPTLSALLAADLDPELADEFEPAECGSKPVDRFGISTARRDGPARSNTGFTAEICAV